MYERFKKLLELNNKKAAEVSAATGIATAVFSEWKKGKSVPKVDKLVLIADYFNISLDYLVTGKETKATGLIENEQKLINLFRTSTEDGKETILKVAEAINAESKKESNVTNASGKFNKSDDEELKPFA